MLLEKEPVGKRILRYAKWAAIVIAAAVMIYFLLVQPPGGGVR